jgi:hypothetical protein
MTDHADELIYAKCFFEDLCLTLSIPKDLAPIIMEFLQINLLCEECDRVGRELDIDGEFERNCFCESGPLYKAVADEVGCDFTSVLDPFGPDCLNCVDPEHGSRCRMHICDCELDTPIYIGFCYGCYKDHCGDDWCQSCICPMM